MKKLFTLTLAFFCLLLSACNDGSAIEEKSEVSESSVPASSEIEPPSSSEETPPALEPVSIIESSGAIFGMVFDLTLEEFMDRFNSQLPENADSLSSFEIDETAEVHQFHSGSNDDDPIYSNPVYVSPLENISLNVTLDHFGKMIGYSVFSDTKDDLDDIKKWNLYLLDILGIELTDEEIEGAHDFDNYRTDIDTEGMPFYYTDGLLRDHVSVYGFDEYLHYDPVTDELISVEDRYTVKIGIELQLYRE